MGLMKKYLTEGDYNTKVDAWLDKNGWKETHGIALYTHPKYPGIGVDTNSGKANIEVFKSKQLVFNDEGAMMDYTSNPSSVSKAIEKGKIIYELHNALKGRKGWKNPLITSSSVSLFAVKRGYGIHIYTDQNRLSMGLSGYDVKGEDKNRESIYASNYNVKFPFKKSSISDILKQITTWEKEQWT